ncbi:MAG TPA: DNA-3-methyladenine glycosylase [Propionibacteriaceae bacterium]|nr:DNA-3-methyladenine glycosylase [Propionibacteriaceae bacterium]
MIDFSRPAPEVAPLLLGGVISHGGVSVRLTEVEAYAGELDPASHAFRGPTPRAAVMFGPPGRMYLYLSYGAHVCGNIVCSPEGEASAVLLRAGEVVAGLELARERRVRPGRRRPPDDHLARGPGNLGRALGFAVTDSGTPLSPPGEEGFSFEVRDVDLPVARGPRIGISRGVEVAWRFWIEGDPTVSGRRRPRHTNV